MSKRLDIESILNKKINRLTIVQSLGFVGRIRYCVAVCECGIEKVYNLYNIIYGKSRSCGCLPKDAHTIHGLHNHPIYSVWEDMIARCYNENHKKYRLYGGRGVRVCDEWRHDPKSFFDWAINKWKPGLSLDKDKLFPDRLGMLYCPEFCCFLTPKENSMYRNNSKIMEFNGESMCVSQWADKANISYQTFQSRLRYGWSMERILGEPVKQLNKAS